MALAMTPQMLAIMMCLLRSTGASPLRDTTASPLLATQPGDERTPPPNGERMFEAISGFFAPLPELDSDECKEIVGMGMDAAESALMQPVLEGEYHTLMQDIIRAAATNLDRTEGFDNPAMLFIVDASFFTEMNDKNRMEPTFIGLFLLWQLFKDQQSKTPSSESLGRRLLTKLLELGAFAEMDEGEEQRRHRASEALKLLKAEVPLKIAWPSDAQAALSEVKLAAQRRTEVINARLEGLQQPDAPADEVEAVRRLQRSLADVQDAARRRVEAAELKFAQQAQGIVRDVLCRALRQLNIFKCGDMENPHGVVIDERKWRCVMLRYCAEPQPQRADQGCSFFLKEFGGRYANGQPFPPNVMVV